MKPKYLCEVTVLTLDTVFFYYSLVIQTLTNEVVDKWSEIKLLVTGLMIPKSSEKVTMQFF